PCTVLAEALGLAVEETADGTGGYFPSVRAIGWAGPQPEVRVGFLERLRTTGTGVAKAEPLALDVADGSPAAMDVTLEGGGRAVVIACDYPCHLEFWRMLLGRLGVRATTVADGATPGLATTVTADATGQKLVHLINVSVQPQRFTLTVAGEVYAGGTVLELPARTGLMLPLDVRLDAAVLRWATAELDGPGDGSMLSLRRGAGPGSA
ncbi:hypothetical protein ACWFRM_42505, partial [Streptomyces sp. NPDC055144]